MEINVSVTFKYVAPGASPKDAIDLFQPDSAIRIPNAGEVVTLPVQLSEGQGEMEKDYRVVRIYNAFSGFSPNLTHQIVHVYVTDLEEEEEEE